MSRRNPEYVITTVRGKKPGEEVDGVEHLDFKCEHIVNARAVEGYRLQELVAVSGTQVILVMVKP